MGFIEFPRPLIVIIEVMIFPLQIVVYKYIIKV